MLQFTPLVRGGAGAVLALLGLVVPASLSAQEIPETPAAEAVARSVLIDTVFVDGNQRVTDDVIRQISGLRPGGTVSGMDIQDAIRRLMATRNFESVEIYADGEPSPGTPVRLTIEVDERPVIANVEFRGLTRVSARAVRDTVGIRENQPFNPAQVVQTESMLRNLLARAGFQVESIDTTMVAVPDQEGTYRLVYEVVEGPRLTIAEVEFRGNQAFSDSDLAAAMRTRPEGFWWFRTGRYDSEALAEDLWSRLPEFYGSRGYIDFTVLSDTLIVNPTSGHARVVIEVEEGPQYMLGDFDIEGNSRFSSDQLTQIFTAQRRSVLGLPFFGSGQRAAGEVFDRSAVNAATGRIGQLYRNEGYLYSEIEPILERVPPANEGDPHRVNVTLAVVERMPFHVREIRIAGNTFTHESVIRDQIFILPGDVYNEERLIQSYQSISALGFFDTPLPLPGMDADPETGEVDLTFTVNERQTGSINFGTMFGGQRGGGVSGFIGYTQPNLFGQAKAAEVRAEYGWGRNAFQATYSDPALFGTRNSGTASLFHMGDRYFNFADGRRIQTGASFRYGMPIPWMFRTRAFVGYSLSSTRYEAVGQDCVEGDVLSIFCLPTATASNLSLGLARDTRNHPTFPTVGTRQSVNLAHTGGPLGGDGNFRKLTTELDWWVPAGTFGGATGGIGGIRTAIGLQARAGGIFGDAGLFPFERFFMGGTQFGQQLRGYDETEITPLGYIDRNDPRFQGQSSVRLGDAFFLLSAEYAVRFTDNISVSVFGDAGNVWNRAAEIDPTRLFRSAGLGLTLVTPFGPLGLDYAYGFDRDVPGWKFHFKLGQTGF